MVKIEQNFIENSLIILTKQTLDVFLSFDNPSELIALYTFYYYTAKWQGTNQPKCTTDYVAKGLHWNRTKVAKIKKQLIELGLIEDKRITDEAGKVKGYYIKMNYIFKKESLEKIQCTQNPPSEFEVQKPSVLKTKGVGFEYTNALSDNNLNALSAVNNKKGKNEPIPKKRNNSFDELIDSYTNNKELRQELKAHLLVRKHKWALTNRAVEIGFNELDKLAVTDTEKIQIVQNAIVKGNAKFYPVNKINKSTYSEPEDDYDIYAEIAKGL